MKPEPQAKPESVSYVERALSLSKGGQKSEVNGQKSLTTNHQPLTTNQYPVPKNNHKL